jgi:diguanylate cyclase (GGDEF)-like protein/PAS domain S-box-containing protein
MASDATSTRRSSIEWLGLALVLGLVAGVLSFALYRDRASIASDEANRIRLLSGGVEENLTRQLAALDNALAAIRTDLERLGLGTDSVASSSRLRMLGDAMPGVHTIVITDADATIVAASRSDLLGTSSAQRAFILSLDPSHDARSLHVCAPFRPSAGPLMIAVAKQVRGPDGRFAGVVMATLDPSYFRVMLQSVLYAPDMRVALAHGDGKIFVNMPVDEQRLGMDLAKPGSMFTRHQRSGQALTLVTGRALATGDDRMMAIRTIGGPAVRMDKPMVLAVSRQQSALYRPWREKAMRFGFFFAVVALGSASGLSFAQRRRLAFDRLAAAAAQDRRLGAERLSLALEASNLALFDWDIRARRIYHSAQAGAMRGEPAIEATESTDALRSFVHPDDLETIDRKLKDALTGTTPVYDAEFRLRRRAGDWVWIRARGRVVERDADGRALRLAGTYADIDERKAAEERLRRLAEHDPLTGLPNRSLFHDRLHEAMARCTSEASMALLFLDIDRFKEINDTWGHEAGDQVLATYAVRMRELMRQTDTVARLAGDEFTLILNGLRSPADAVTLAAKLVQTLRQPIAVGGRQLEVTASIGVAICRPGETDQAGVLRRADAALYEAKRRGRNGFFIDDGTPREGAFDGVH